MKRMINVIMAIVMVMAMACTASAAGYSTRTMTEDERSDFYKKSIIMQVEKYVMDEIGDEATFTEVAIDDEDVLHIYVECKDKEVKGFTTAYLILVECEPDHLYSEDEIEDFFDEEDALLGYAEYTFRNRLARHQ